MLFEVFNMADGCYTGYTAPNRLNALIQAAEYEYRVTPDITEIVKGVYSLGFRDLAILKST